MNSINIKGFTLVELIIVITILAILGSISFIGYFGYVKDSKKTKIVSNITQFSKGLEIFAVNTEKYPFPEEYSTIELNGTTNSYQGLFGEKTANLINTQIKDENEYLYSITKNQKSYQIMTNINLEAGVIQKTYAENENYYTLGNGVGFIFEGTNTVPLNKTINITSSNSNNYTLLVNNQEISDITEIEEKINYTKNCDTLKNAGIVKNSGVYTITGNDGNDLKVYCSVDMTDGNGWTLLASVRGDSKKFGNYYNDGIWFNPEYNKTIPTNLTDIDFLSQSYEKLDTNEILLCYKDTSTCYNFKHNMGIPFYNFFRDGISYVDYSYSLVGYGDQGSIESKYNFFETLGIKKDAGSGLCGFLGINYQINNDSSNSNNTKLIIGYGGDADGPCTSWSGYNGGITSTIDNYLVGVGGFLWMYNHLSFDDKNPKYRPAGASSYILEDTTTTIINTSTLGNQKAYVTDQWYIFGR